MHESVMNFVQWALPEREVKDRRVLEVGSLNVNGSVRTIIEPLGPMSYTGIDITAGPGVDLVTSAEVFADSQVPAGWRPLNHGTVPYDPNQFEVVVSTEMLEHAEEWLTAVQAMAALCSNVLVVTARGPGFPRHDYPSDYWRFTPPDFRMMFEREFQIVALLPDPQVPGVFMKAYRREVPLRWWAGPEKAP